MRACVTGGAGFIGSNLVDALLQNGHHVSVLDNLKTGRRSFLQSAEKNKQFRLVIGDVLERDALVNTFTGCDVVFHLQANADVRYGLDHPTLDLEQNTVATSNVLEAMRKCEIRRIVFSSTGSIYGEPEIVPTPENAEFPVQTSLYGASKLACEGLIQAYAAGFEFSAVICRFVSILGERYTHGHVYDFVKSLLANPDELMILGDGRQEKSYLYVGDCVRAIMQLVEEFKDSPGAHIYNLGTDETITVDTSAGIIAESLGLSPALLHSGGVRGWTGDSPLIHLDTSRLRSTGWLPTLTIRQAILKTVDWLRQFEFTESRAQR